MKEPTFDRNGYPTEDTLRMIREWEGDWTDMFEFLRAIWKYPERWSIAMVEDEQCYRFSTGGWSGNEELVSALEQNFFAMSLFWVSSHRGGLYYFAVPNGRASDA